jgi:hypothetical protein
MLVRRDIVFGNRRHYRDLIAGSEEGIARTSSPAASTARGRSQPLHRSGR